MDTALAEVPVNIFPLTDDTDFKTIEGAVAYNAAGMALRWHFVTSAGAYTVTSVTPTTGGNYDWTDQGDSGIYTIEIPASGGASINNDTEGYGWFTGVATGVLPWRGPVIGFRAAALNDALTDGGDTLDVNVTQFGGTNATTSGGRPEVNTTHAAGTAWGSGAITAASIASDAITAAKIADNAIDAGAIASGAITSAKFAAGAIDATAIATNAIDADALATDAVTEIQAGLSTLTQANIRTALGMASANLDTQLSTIDDFLDTEVAAIKTVTDAIGPTGSGLSAIPWNAAWDAEVQSEATDALNSYDPPTKAELDSAVANVSVNEIQSTAIADLFNTDSGTTYGSAVAGSAVKEIADNAGGASLTVQDIVDGVWDEATSGHTTAGTTGKALTDAGSAGDPWSTALPGAYGAGTAGKILGDNLNATVASRASQTSLDTVDDFLDTEIAAIKAKTDTLPADPADASDVASGIAGLDAKLDTIDNFIDTEVAAIKTVVDAILLDTAEIGTAGAGLTNINLPDQTMNITGNLSGSVGSVTGNVGGNVTGSVGSVATGGISSGSLAASALNAMADALLDRNMASGTDNGTNSTAVRTPRQALRANRNKVTIAAGTATVTKEDDVTTSWTAAVSTAAGDPISGVDPT